VYDLGERDSLLPSGIAFGVHEKVQAR